MAADGGLHQTKERTNEKGIKMERRRVDKVRTSHFPLLLLSLNYQILTEEEDQAKDDVRKAMKGKELHGKKVKVQNNVLFPYLHENEC